MDDTSQLTTQAELLACRVTRHTAARYRTIGDDTFIVLLQNESFHYLEAVGSFIWHLADGNRTGDEIAQAVAQRFDADPSLVRRDVAKFVRTLSAKGLVTIEGSPMPVPARPFHNPDLMAQSARMHTVVQQKNIPLTAILMLTHACNLRCYYCYDAGWRSHALNFSQWRGILDQLAAAGTLFVRLTGGEPTIHPEFMPILEYAAEAGFAVTVVSNTTLITPEMAGRFAQLQLECVLTTFHGGSAEVHDPLAGRVGAFERSRQSVDMLLDRGVSVLPAMVVTQRNYHDLDNYLCMIDKWGLRQPHLSIDIYPRTSGSTDTLDERLAPERIQDLMRRGLFKPVPIPDMYCGAGSTKCCITPEGQVTPCHLFMTGVGDLTGDTFAHIWNHSPTLLKMREEQWFTVPAECEACPAYRKYCRPCPAQVYHEYGDFRKVPTYFCRLVDMYTQTTQEVGALV